ncbi:NADPH:quinone reductase [Sedimentitalea todarodis]|uniref:NADPH:quinone reductase n=1 Tax=Sedimentitalea todarodis TaxID=1631240 RepID=A0ABU3VDE4_9RHOB|nr:NADPH:quinone reductase [Sedimentitalea todarodis]MDU9004181.1 NADPH:quinone reductase [Sedimentitalea todarodis]
MKAITYDRFGAARDVLRLQELESPRAGPGEVTVDLVFSGVNPSDVKARAGSRPGVTKPPYPQVIPHSDGAGVITAVGEGVNEARIGERVWIWNGQWRRAFGTAASRITLPQKQAVVLPDSVSFETGAILGIPGLTAAFTVFNGGEVAGQTVLIQGGAGTVGLLAVQLAKWGGAKVIATARGAGVDRAREAGADAVVDYTDADRVARILAANSGQPVDRIIEVEFGKNIAVDTDVIAENGTICAYGSALEMEPVLPFYPLLFKAVTIEIALIYLLTESQRHATVDRLTRALSEGALHCPVERIFPLADCAAAHEAVEAGNRAGAILLGTA